MSAGNHSSGEHRLKPSAAPAGLWASRRVVVIPLLILLAAGLFFWLPLGGSGDGSIYQLAPNPRIDRSQLGRLAPGEKPLEISSADVPYPVTVQRGQTVGGLLADLGLEAAESHEAVSALAEHLDVRKIRAGEQGAAYFDENQRLTSLELQLRGRGRIEIERFDKGWRSIWRESVKEARVRRIEGELTQFLEAAIRQGGGPPQLAVSMSNVLQWDLDFNRDLRVGDRFEVVFEEIFLDGEAAGVGRVLALIYETQGKQLEAYGFTDRGYYDASGRPLQKMFLRSPLPFTRVTSRFSHRRFHPVLKVHRPHYGVDFGAPSGTPVRSTANGVVTFAARKGGAGKMVEVRHSNGFRTLYLHLSGYASGIRQGVRVSQGDLLGYVGSTGLSTGPHLDYRVKKNGKYLDPLKLPSEPADPIQATEMAAFIERRDTLRQALDGEAQALSGLQSSPPTVPEAQAPVTDRPISLEASKSTPQRSSSGSGPVSTIKK